MRLFDSPPQLAHSALLLLSLAADVLARPSPDPKSAWVRTRGKKNLLKNSRRWINDTASSIPVSSAVPTCLESNATVITAPKENIWGGLTDIEAAGVVSFLFSQADLNLTTTDEAGEWDNSV